MKNLLEQLWNSKKDSYSECKHPILQRATDYIKNKYVHLTSQEDPLHPGITEIDMDLHLQQRRTESLLKKCGYIEI